MRKVGAFQSRPLVRGAKAITRVVPYRFQQPVTGRPGGSLGEYQALVGEGREKLGDATATGFSADLLRRLERPAAEEDRHAAQHRLLVFGQQLVAPVHQRPQRPVTWQRGPRSADEQAETLVEVRA